ncbi:MAG: hypothetical protein ACLU9T_07020 [Blautia faecis]
MQEERAVSPDVAGIACDYVEKNTGDDGFVALYLIGAAGGRAPVEKAVMETFVRGEKSGQTGGKRALESVKSLATAWERLYAR